MDGYLTTEDIAKDFEATIYFESGDKMDLAYFSPKSYNLLKNILTYTYDTTRDAVYDLEETFEDYGLEILNMESNCRGIKGTKLTLAVIEPDLFLKSFPEIEESTLDPDTRGITIISPNSIGLFLN